MADNRIWTTNNINDLTKIAEAFGLPSDLQDIDTSTQSLGYLLQNILLELQRIRVGMSMMVDVDLGDVDIGPETDV